VAGILLKDAKVFTARRDHSGALGGLWEFPGGKVEERESDREALEREFMEEFGAKVKAGAFLGEESFAHRGATRILSAYLVELEPGSSLVPREHVELRWSRLGDLDRLDLVDSDRKLLPFLRDYLSHQR
jgi:8-oxo-dGTP diphosphatase